MGDPIELLEERGRKSRRRIKNANFVVRVIYIGIFIFGGYFLISRLTGSLGDKYLMPAVIIIVSTMILSIFTHFITKNKTYYRLAIRLVSFVGPMIMALLFFMLSTK